MFLVGLLFGPLHHYVYGWLQNVLPKRNLKTVTKKILFDQIVMSPICILSFFYGMGLMERKPVKEINEETAKKFVEVYVVRKIFMRNCVWVMVWWLCDWLSALFRF